MYGQTNCGGARREHCAAGRGTGGSDADGSLGASDDAAAQAEKEDATPSGHSLIFTVLFFWIFFSKKKCTIFLPDIFGWLYSELYLGRFQTDGLKNRTLIAKVFV